MAEFFNEWAYVPIILTQIFSSPMVWVYLLIGLVLGYVVGVIPGLGPTMGMALLLGIVFRLVPLEGMALLIGVLVASLCSGGITASLINIPGTSAAAATTLDGYPMTKQGKGRDAAGLSYMSSVIGSILGTICIFLIQPFVASIALKFGDWEVFLFCLFGVLICGSLAGEKPIKGWISAAVGFFLAMTGADSVQSVVRYTFGMTELLSGYDTVVAMIGLFGMSEVFYVLIKKQQKLEYKQEQGFPRIRLDILARNKLNIIRSTLVGLWVGFIPGVGESAACWLSYDVAKRSSKTKEQFGKGNPEGVIAAETANNASSVGALIPALALGVPGSATAAIFIAALFMMNYRPGPTLMIDSPGILAQICVLFLIGAILMIGIGYVLTRYVIRFLTIPNKYLMPIVTVFCALGAYGSTYTWSSVIFVLIFGLIGMVMKLYQYPIAPMVLGLLVGNIADSSLRRALMQYSHNPLEMVTRPFGLAVIVVLVIMFILGVRTNVTQEDVEKEIEE